MVCIFEYQKPEKETKIEVAKQKNETKPRIQPIVVIPSDTVSQSKRKDSLQQDVITTDKVDSEQVPNTDENIVVKQDQLLISTPISIEDKNTEGEKKKDESLSETAVQQLNPASDLPEPEKKTSSCL